jgi:hypothetical protein
LRQPFGLKPQATPYTREDDVLPRFIHSTSPIPTQLHRDYEEVSSGAQETDATNNIGRQQHTDAHQLHPPPILRTMFGDCDNARSQLPDSPAPTPLLEIAIDESVSQSGRLPPTNRRSSPVTRASPQSGREAAYRQWFRLLREITRQRQESLREVIENKELMAFKREARLRKIIEIYRRNCQARSTESGYGQVSASSL